MVALAVCQLSVLISSMLYYAGLVWRLTVLRILSAKFFVAGYAAGKKQSQPLRK